MNELAWIFGLILTGGLVAVVIIAERIRREFKRSQDLITDHLDELDATKDELYTAINQHYDDMDKIITRVSNDLK